MTSDVPGGRRLRRVPPAPASTAAVVPWRGLVALLRAPRAPVAGGAWTAVAVAGGAVVPVLPRAWWVTAGILVAVTAHRGASGCLEPLRQEVDDPGRSAHLPLPLRRLVLRHLAAPVLVGLVGGLVGLAALAVLGADAGVAPAVAVALPAVALAAAAATCRPPLRPESLVGVDTPVGSSAGAPLVLWLAQGPLAACVVVLPVLLVASAASTGTEPPGLAGLLVRLVPPPVAVAAALAAVLPALVWCSAAAHALVADDGPVARSRPSALERLLRLGRPSPAGRR